MLRTSVRAARVLRTRPLVAVGLGASTIALAPAFSSAALATPAATATPAVSYAALKSQPVRSVVLYQYDSCPFCNAVRAYLDAAKIPYTVVEVNPLFKSEVGFSSYKKVPMAIINGEQVNDSGAIIQTLDAMLSVGAALDKSKAPVSQRYVTNLTPVSQGTAEEERLRSWVYSSLIPTLSPNIYRTAKEALDSFDYITQRNFPAWSALPAKYVGAVAMYLISKRLKTKYGITDERQALYTAVNEFSDGLGDKPFAGGPSPNLADVTAFGVLRAISGLATFDDMMGNSRIGPWYKRMEVTVGPSALEHRISEAPVKASS